MTDTKDLPGFQELDGEDAAATMAPVKKFDVTPYQTHWHPEEICGTFPATPDTYFLFGRWDALVRRSAADWRVWGRVLDVACGNARDIAALNERGWEGWGLDPSPLQLRDAKEAAERSGRRINLIQGVSEWLPFKQGMFDAVICKSALDHFVDLEGGMSEFVRVLKPDGRAVVSVDNYRSLSTRFSRFLYRILRLAWPPARRKHLFWDSPVPRQHMYECTFQNTRDLGRPYFVELESYGVSLLWGFPGWGRFLSLSPARISSIILRSLNQVARRVPRLADVVVFVWQPTGTASAGTEVESVRKSQRADE